MSCKFTNTKITQYSIIGAVLFAFVSATTFAVNAQEQNMTPLEIVKSTYEGETSEENGRNLQAHLAPDAKWTEAAGFPYSGTYTGFDEIAKNVFARLASEWTDYRFVPENYVADDHRVVAYGTYYGTYNATGKAFSARVAHVWKVEDGKIVKFEQFVDSAPVKEAME
ncbi:Ketosteroid isomerase-related protein [Phaeobacter gallaeciensis]|uniref:Ketosteroid isomerase-related protein n=2 Tax=Phaeobacter gallaeciensis TaxID=60890 RepID=A0AAC9Z6Y8_9RHOB|nr:nuclear transport factor 2 family protein [Phaeobacter gallaeciensis]AHD08833.1 Ketosteroid isomerase-related protein [Phaeobacter gallaeciensis DSM 26640]ATE92099.1 Ketosteroid isomerase-related protein [Phaeobacter gallaeciensis]ATE98077.1 Ketosteroid isomerase-related protein [Phaeobacter gallaeciensis]ATF00715.1 Ketosteroid isomerase-related protein [Phaeobacter gallaeciensis]ATF05146.1 Ketosteroid isomerase-related protein [Phaeobacter gallaeciensis]